MNTTSRGSPGEKEKPLLGGAGLCKLTTCAAYHVFHVLKLPCCWGCWALEQRASRFRDRIDNERNAR